MQHLQVFEITWCASLRYFNINSTMIELSISNSKYFYNYNSLNNTNYTLKKYKCLNIIKQWYKRVKLSKKLWKYAEIVLMDQMNPYKKDNEYLQKYIKENVYDE
jgi:archaellin